LSGEFHHYPDSAKNKHMEIRLLAILIVFFGAINLFRMAMFLIGSDIYGLLLSKGKKSRLTHFPSFSVVIPAHNEEGTIIRAIDSVVNCDYPIDKRQIIVVDDGSTDRTPELVTQYLREHSLSKSNVELVRQSNSGKARALNNGMRNHAKGKLIMCLDADSFLDKQALSNVASHFTNPKLAALSANVKIINGPGILNLIQRYEYLVCYQMKRAESLFNCEYIVGGIGSVFRKSVLEKIDYYDTNTVTEDIDLTMKILQKGNKIYQAGYGADVIAFTESVLNIKGLILQRFRWKWGRSQTFLKNWKMFFSKESIFTKSLSWFYLPFAIYGDIAYFFEPVLFVYILAISLYYRDPLTIISAWVVISTYISLNIMAEDTLPWKEKLKLVLGAPFMYPLLYILSFVEYVALIKSLLRLPSLRESINEDVCGWTHVERSALEINNDNRNLSYSTVLKIGLTTFIILLSVFTVLSKVVVKVKKESRISITGTFAQTMSSSTPTNIPLPQSANLTNKRYHLVKEGESLWQIAKKYYGRGVDWTMIPTSDGSTVIYPGDVIEIPQIEL